MLNYILIDYKNLFFTQTKTIVEILHVKCMRGLEITRDLLKDQ